MISCFPCFSSVTLRGVAGLGGNGLLDCKTSPSCLALFCSLANGVFGAARRDGSCSCCCCSRAASLPKVSGDEVISGGALLWFNLTRLAAGRSSSSESEASDLAVVVVVAWADGKKSCRRTAKGVGKFTTLPVNKWCDTRSVGLLWWSRPDAGASQCPAL